MSHTTTATNGSNLEKDSTKNIPSIDFNLINDTTPFSLQPKPPISLESFRMSPSSSSTFATQVAPTFAPKVGFKDNLELSKKILIKRLLLTIQDKSIVWSDWVDHIPFPNSSQQTSARATSTKNEESVFEYRATRIICITNRYICILKSINNRSQNIEEFLIRKILLADIFSILHEPVKSSEGVVCINFKATALPHKVLSMLGREHSEKMPNNRDDDLVFICYRKLEFFEYLTLAFSKLLNQKPTIYAVENVKNHIWTRKNPDHLPVEPLQINPFILEASVGREHYKVIGNSAILNWLIRYDDSMILFSDLVNKRTVNGKIIQKILIITDLALYIVHKKKLQMDRRVMLDEIQSIVMEQASSVRSSLSARSNYNLLSPESLCKTEFAIIIPHEYDLLLQSSKADEIISIIRKQSNAWLKYDSKLSEKTKLKITQQYKDLIKQRQDVNEIRNMIKKAIASNDENMLRKSLELARCIGLEKDINFIAGQQEFSSLKEFKQTRQAIRQCVYECNEKELKEWLDEIRVDHTSNKVSRSHLKLRSEDHSMNVLYKVTVPYLEKMVYLRQLLDGKIVPMYRKSYAKMKEQMEDEFDFRVHPMKHMLSEIKKEEALQMIIEEEKKAIINAGPVKPLTDDSELPMPTMRQIIDRGIIDTIATMDCRYIQQIIDFFDLFGVTNEKEQFNEKVCYRTIAIEELNKLVSMCEQKPTVLNVNVTKTIAKFILKGTYYVIPENRRNVTMKVYVDMFDKLGYHTCGPTSNIRLDHDLPQKFDPVAMTPRRKASYNYYHHQQETLNILEDVDSVPNSPLSPVRTELQINYDEHGVVSIDMSQLGQHYQSQQMHYVISLELNDPKEATATRLPHESRIIRLNLMKEDTCHYSYLCDLEKIDIQKERCILCVLSRVANPIDLDHHQFANLPPKTTFSNVFEQYEYQQQLGEEVTWEILAMGDPITIENNFNRQVAMFREFLGILPPPKEMHVTILAGRSLAPRDRSGKSDPFVIVEYKGKKMKTKCVKATLNPTFDVRSSVFKFRIEDGDPGVLYITCWDRDVLGPPSFMGEFYLPVQRAHTTEKWYKLCENEEYKEEGIVTGDLKLRVEFDYGMN